ncbi:MAG: cytidylate kinase family protein [Candidatus Woesearchaeota archaeon]
MIITISGVAGSGKSTVGRILAQKLGLRYYSVGDLRRKMAEQMGITLEELNRLGEENDFTDKSVDEYQKELGSKEDNFVIDGRLSFFFIPNSVKVFLDVSDEEAARRIMKDKRTAEEFKSFKEALKGIRRRNESDALRYKKYYGVNVYDKKNFDLVINTDKIPAEEVADRIIRFLKKSRA